MRFCICAKNALGSSANAAVSFVITCDQDTQTWQANGERIFPRQHVQLLANNGLKFDLSRASRSVAWVGAFFIFGRLAELQSKG